MEHWTPLFCSWIIIYSFLNSQSSNGRYIPTENESRLEIVSADDDGNLYLYCEVIINQQKNTIQKFEWDVITIACKANDYGDGANKCVINVLTEMLEVEREQLSIFKEQDKPLKIVMLTNWNGTELQLIHRIDFKFKYVLNPPPKRKFVKKFPLDDDDTQKNEDLDAIERELFTVNTEEAKEYDRKKEELKQLLEDRKEEDYNYLLKDGDPGVEMDLSAEKSKEEFLRIIRQQEDSRFEYEESVRLNKKTPKVKHPRTISKKERILKEKARRKAEMKNRYTKKKVYRGL